MAKSKINRPLFQDVEYTASYSVSGNAAVTITDSQLGISTPSGYELVGVVAAWTGSTNAVIRNLGAYGDNNSVRNLSSSTVTGNFGITIRYMRVS